MNNDLRIVLVGAAKAAHDTMLTEVKADGRTTINSSKLINWIVLDYFNRYFQQRKSVLCKEHFNSRKFVMEAMKTGDPDELRRAFKAAAKSLASPKRTEQNKGRKAEIKSVAAAQEPE